MKSFILVGLLTLIMFANLAGAESEGWSKSLVGLLNLSQTQFDNWSAGGENTVSFQLNLDGSINRESEKMIWSNKGKISYGESKIGDAEMRKSSDEISMESVVQYKANFLVNPYLALSCETQIFPG